MIEIEEQTTLRGVMKSLAEEDLKPLVSMVLKDRSIDLSKYKDRYLRRRIGVRLRASGAHNLKHYMKIMSQDEDEYRTFINTLTVNTSNFFRNRDCFEIISGEIMPALVPMVGKWNYSSPFIWSVGCARGEEAYSLAMLVIRHPGLRGNNSWKPILATDIDEGVLEEAREGLYSRRSFDAVPLEIKEFFIESDSRRMQVPEEIRRMVVFARHDILRDNLPGRYLLVLCRNLLIYLEKEAQEKLMKRLARSLHPGGFLVLGKSEILIGEAREHFIPVSPKERIYQKVNTGDSALELIPESRRQE